MNNLKTVILLNPRFYENFQALKISNADNFSSAYPEHGSDFNSSENFYA